LSWKIKGFVDKAGEPPARYRVLSMRALVKALFGSQLRRNVFSGSFAVLLQLGVMAVSYPAYLHFLGYDTYGLWLVASTVLTLSQLGNLGLSQALMKLIAEHHARGDREAVQSFASTATLFLLTLGALITLGVTVFCGPLIDAFALTGEHARVAHWLFPLTALLSGYVLVVEGIFGALAGLGRIDVGNYARITNRTITLVVSLVLLWRGRGIESLLIGNVVGWVVMHAICLYAAHGLARLRTTSVSRFSYLRLKELIQFGLPSVASTALSMLLAPFNNLMLSRYVGLRAVPVLDMAHRAAMELRGLLAVGLSALIPEISALSAQKAWARIDELNARARLLVYRVGGALYIPLLVAASLFLHLWLGSRYVEPLALVFRIVLVGSFLSLLAVPPYYSLMGLGYTGSCLTGHVIQSGVNVLIVTAALAVSGGLSLPTMAISVSVGYGCTTVFLLYRQHVISARAVAAT
jgi:O-antigen/teichoic acid export membrane protein